MHFFITSAACYANVRFVGSLGLTAAGANFPVGGHQNYCRGRWCNKIMMLTEQQSKPEMVKKNNVIM